MSMRLSRNFWLDEYVATSTGLFNLPTQRPVRRLMHLTNRLIQPLRDAVGQPVNVTSGYRSPEVNRAVDGAPESQHLIGEAADINSVGYTPSELVGIIQSLKLPYDQLIDETKTHPDGRVTTWLHVSLRFPIVSNRFQAFAISR